MTPDLELKRLSFVRRMREICACGGMRPPSGWRFFSVCPLMNVGETAFLMNEGACVMTGCRGAEGFFSGLCAGDGQSAARLLEEMLAWQKQRGARSVVGPVSPALFDTECGLPLGHGSTSCFSSDAAPFLDVVLREKGFFVTGSTSLYALDFARFNRARYERAAQESMRRFGYGVVSVRQMGTGTACRAMAALLDKEPLLGMTGRSLMPALGALGRAWSQEMSFLALDEAGRLVGYILALYDRKSRIVRAASVQVASLWQRRGVTAALGMALFEAAACCKGIECGVIEDGNDASKWGVLNAGCRKISEFRRYGIEITHI